MYVDVGSARSIVVEARDIKFSAASRWSPEARGCSASEIGDEIQLKLIDTLNIDA